MGFFDRFRSTPTAPTPGNAEGKAEEGAPAVDRGEVSATAEISGDTDLSSLPEDPKERATAATELGQKRQAAGDLDGAIVAFEAVIAAGGGFGPAYTALLGLYNEKLSASAASGSMQDIQSWSSKLDELMAASKQTIRSMY